LKLRMELFQQVRITHMGNDAAVFLPEALCPLLAFLIIGRNRSHSRREIVENLWQRDADPALLHRLSNCLYRLRQALEPTEQKTSSVLQAPSGQNVFIEANANLWIDVAAFEETALQVTSIPNDKLTVEDGQKLEDAIQLYTGDILPYCLDDWLVRENDRLRGLKIDCLEKLMALRAQQGWFTRALEAGHLILAEDPLREDIQYQIMELHLAKGDRVNALRQYQACEKILKRELNIKPIREIQNIYRRILDGDQIHLTPITLKSPDIRRETTPS